MKQRTAPNWKKGLCDLISRTGRIPDDHRTPLSTKPNEKKRKICRTIMPTADILLAMKNVAQNSPEWMGFRSGSFGASAHSTKAGWNDYTTNVDEWRIDSGIQAQKMTKNYYGDQFPCDHGHYREDEAGEVYSYLMGVESKVTGMYLHPKAPWMHCSPDLLRSAPASRLVCHNRYTICDPLHMIVEIKCPIRKPYLVRGEDGYFRPTIPACYLLQVINQIDIMNAECCDFVCHWRFNEVGGPVADKEHPGRFKYAEHMVLRVYKNQSAADEIRRLVEEHKAHVERAHDSLDKGEKPLPPAFIDKLNTFAATTIIPLKYALFHTTLDNPEATTAVDENGDLLGETDTEITDFWDHEPISVTLNDVDSDLPKGKTLKCVPTYTKYCKISIEDIKDEIIG